MIRYSKKSTKHKGSKSLKNSPENKIKSTKRWKVIGIVSACLAGLAIIATTAFLLWPKPPDQPIEDTTIDESEVEPVKFYSKLTGLEITSQDGLNAPITAVMIENSEEARPQSGLYDAEIVYEAIAEGGITRFAALYQNIQSELIGPVRSLRMHFLEWAVPYQASIAHVGGADDALQSVRSEYRDIDQFFAGNYYWRTTDRWAPHNVYTDSQHLSELNTSRGYTSSEFIAWPRKLPDDAEEPDTTDDTTPDATNISFDFSSAFFSVAYSYDAETNTYKRNLAGQPHLDREKGQIAPAVVIVIEVDQTLRPGSSYTNMVTSGTGQAYIFQNGKVITATWSKPDRNHPLALLDANGAEIPLEAGQTWVSAIPAGNNISWQ